MKKVLFNIMILAALIFSGCSTTQGYSNAQQDAVTGTIIGAVAGAIIGHQSGERDAGAAVGAVTGAVLGYAHGNEIDKRVHYSQGHTQPVVIQQQPRTVIRRDPGFTCRPPVYRPPVYRLPVYRQPVYRPPVYQRGYSSRGYRGSPSIIVVEIDINGHRRYVRRW